MFLYLERDLRFYRSQSILILRSLECAGSEREIGFFYDLSKFRATSLSEIQINIKYLNSVL